MALLPEQIAKVQQYEEYRLKLLYEIILQDEGRPLTNFDKKYAIEPAGYTFDFLKDIKSLPKLNAKSRRYILNRPSFTSALRPNGSE